MKEFDGYINVIKSYGGETSIHPGIVKTKRINMGVQDTKNPTP